MLTKSRKSQGSKHCSLHKVSMNAKELQNINLCLEIAGKLKGQIDDEEAVCDIDKAIELSMQWLNDKTDVSIELYDLLDGEDQGFAIYQQSKEDEHWIDVWNCIIYAFAYICRKVFEDQGAIYFPEPLELVDEETVTLMTDLFKSI